jgi:hypothetical protein
VENGISPRDQVADIGVLFDRTLNNGQEIVIHAVIKIVQSPRRKVIQNAQLVAPTQQSLHEMTADESRTACY